QHQINLIGSVPCKPHVPGDFPKAGSAPVTAGTCIDQDQLLAGVNQERSDGALEVLPIREILAKQPFDLLRVTLQEACIDFAAAVVQGGHLVIAELNSIVAWRLHPLERCSGSCFSLER